MAKFEGYERREAKILACLKEYGISSIDECKEICDAKGIDPYTIVQETQPICFENAKWAYTVGSAIALKEAGADGIMMAEPVSGLLSPMLEEEFSAPYVKQIVDAVQDDEFIVIYHNCGGAVLRLIDPIVSCGAAAYHFGNAIDIKAALEKMPADVVVMGNIDPVGQLTEGTAEGVYAATKALLEQCSVHKNFVISSGCDIPPLAQWENIDAFFGAVEDFYR